MIKMAQGVEAIHSGIPAYTVAEAIVEQLKLWGVKRIYGVVGDAIFGLMDALAPSSSLGSPGKESDILFVAVKHESTAAMMASAEAKLTGNLAVCIAQMGPGLANLMCGLGDAYMDKAPVLVITGQAPLRKIGTIYKQFINQQEMVQAVTVHSQLVTHQDAVLSALQEAACQAVNHHSVAHLSVPQDLFQLPTTAQPRPRAALSAVSIPDAALLQAAGKLMRSAKRPMILVGSNARVNSETLHALAEAWGSGIAMSYGAIGIVPDSAPLMLNGLGEGGNPYVTELFKQSDVVLALGTVEWPEQHVPRAVTVLQWTARRQDLNSELPVAAALVGELADVINPLLDSLKPDARDSNWLRLIRQCKQEWAMQNEAEGRLVQSPLSPSAIIRAVERSVNDDAIVALDEGDSTLWFLRNFRARHQQVLLSRRWRTMGFGLPAAMAAKLCRPDRQVVCITGDGGIGMVLADLLTAVRYHLSIIVIIFRNDTLQMERDKMTLKGLQPYGTAVTNPDFVKLGEACGWIAHSIATLEELEHRLEQAKTSELPVLLDVSTAQIAFPDLN